jgi:PAS domain S-box-containing protein
MTSRTTKLDGLLEAVPDALVGVDRSGVIRLVNHQAELMFGYERDALWVSSLRRSGAGVFSVAA